MAGREEILWGGDGMSAAAYNAATTDLSRLALNDDGTSKEPVYVRDVIGVPHADGYYYPAYFELFNQLHYAVDQTTSQALYNVCLVPYDWRLALDQTAATVLDKIRAWCQDRPFWVIAHSTGCELTRLIYRLLVGNPSDPANVDLSSKMQGAIFLGNPGNGCWEPVPVMLGCKWCDAYRLLLYSQAPVNLANSRANIPAYLRSRLHGQTGYGYLPLTQALDTMDGLATNMPSGNAESYLYNASWWAEYGATVPQAMLTRVKAVNAIMQDYREIPGWKLFGVLGRNVRTIRDLVNLERAQEQDSYSFTTGQTSPPAPWNNGDGVCTNGQSLTPLPWSNSYDPIFYAPSGVAHDKLCGDPEVVQYILWALQQTPASSRPPIEYPEQSEQHERLVQRQYVQLVQRPPLPPHPFPGAVSSLPDSAPGTPPSDTSTLMPEHITSEPNRDMSAAYPRNCPAKRGPSSGSPNVMDTGPLPMQTTE
jgi:hypothetical protein